VTSAAPASSEHAINVHSEQGKLKGNAQKLKQDDRCLLLDTLEEMLGLMMLVLGLTVLMPLFLLLLEILELVRMGILQKLLIKIIPFQLRLGKAPSTAAAFAGEPTVGHSAACLGNNIGTDPGT